MFPLQRYNSGATSLLQAVSSLDSANGSIQAVSITQQLGMFYRQAGSSIYALQIIAAIGLFMWACPLGAEAFFIVPLGLLAIAVGCPLAWYRLVGPHLDDPQVLASAAEFKPGEEVRIVYRQGIRKPLDFERITLQLILREWVRYSCGTDTCTAQHDTVYHEELYEAIGALDAGTLLERRILFTLPPEAMHSFSAPDNRLTWVIKVKLEMVGRSPYEDHFTLYVAPVFAAN